MRRLSALKDAHAKIVPAFDTAGSAKQIRDEGLADCAAVASTLAASHYSLKILDSGIEDDSNNFTRFLLISRNGMSRSMLENVGRVQSSDIKTSLVFSLMNAPGVLFKALGVFSLRDVDLSKIESRPDKLGLVGNKYTGSMYADNGDGSEEAPPQRDSSKFRYSFYIDVADSVYSKVMKKCLGHLSEIAPFVRVLGTYPKNGKLPCSFCSACLINRPCLER